MGTSLRPARSLKHEYELYVEQEVEDYKESVPRNVLLSIGDEAVASLTRAPQIVLTELLLCEEVDRLIVRRLRLPTYSTWRQKRVKLMKERQRPEHWGLTSEDPLVRALRAAPERTLSRALVADVADAAHALFLAANGCQVTALSEQEEAIQRVLDAARHNGLDERVDGRIGRLTEWTADAPLTVVVMSSRELAGCQTDERSRIIGSLQRVTVDGGIHLVQSDGNEPVALTELRSRYRGWTVSTGRGETPSDSFVARKGAA
jgi:hypothetical protein